jgi:hypothetical protein
MTPDLTTCPECGALAEVEWRSVLESTDGPVEHARIRCLRRHWYLLPVASLPVASNRVPPRRRGPAEML